MEYKELVDAVRKLKKEVDKLYIYGAGFYGKDIYHILRRNEIEIDGFIVTQNNQEKEKVFDKPVIQASEVLSDSIGIVIGASSTYTNQIIKYILDSKFDMLHIIDGGKYITRIGGREDLRDSKVLEISTMMGCSVNCKYCPQDVILKQYYKENHYRQRVMTVKDFTTILENIPKEYIINFSGMTEPFNNPDCLTMIQMACETGRKVFLYTTLANVSEETVNALIQLPVYYVTLHVADKFGYACIPTTDEYYCNIKRVIAAKKANGRPFIDFINAQTEPDERVAKICAGEYEIMRSVQNRAGNLKEDEVQHREKSIPMRRKIKCSFCGDDLSNNVVLPDGTLLLCNMDYGMQHVLGNLYQEDYDTIRSKGELQRVLRVLNCEEETENLLCRNCLLAREELRDIVAR